MTASVLFSSRLAFKHIATRSDNLICAVLVLENAVVVKTVMNNFVDL